jgi:hypothetical protein
MVNKPNLYCNTCTYHHGATPYLCFHPNYIGRDGDGVSLTAMEQELVKRMGCFSHSNARDKILHTYLPTLCMFPNGCHVNGQPQICEDCTLLKKTLYKILLEELCLSQSKR